MSPTFSTKKEVTVTGKSQSQYNPFIEFVLIKNQVVLSFSLRATLKSSIDHAFHNEKFNCKPGGKWNR